MTDEPTTWRITPAGATTEMRLPAVRILRRYVDIDMQVAMHVAGLMWDAMFRASPAPPPLPPIEGEDDPPVKP